MERTDNYNYNLNFISNNLTKINLLPVYQNINLNYYIIIYIYNDFINIEINPLQNKCYIKKLIDSYINNKDSYQYYNENNETRLIIPISLQNDTFQEVFRFRKYNSFYKYYCYGKYI